MVLFSSSNTHIRNQIRLLAQADQGFQALFITTRKGEESAVRSYWKASLFGQNRARPRIARMPWLLSMESKGARLHLASEAQILERARRRIVSEAGGRQVAWSHGDPTRPSFRRISSLFSPDEPLSLVDDGAASRFLIRSRRGVRFPFLPESLNPCAESFSLSRSRISQINFFTLYSSESVVSPDTVQSSVPGGWPRRFSSRSSDVWLAGSNFRGPQYINLIESVLADFKLRGKDVLYLPHPKASREHVKLMGRMTGIRVPKNYKTYEDFLAASASAPRMVISPPSTVVDVSIASGIDASRIYVYVPKVSWLPYPHFYRTLVSELRADYPNVHIIDVHVPGG